MNERKGLASNQKVSKEDSSGKSIVLGRAKESSAPG